MKLKIKETFDIARFALLFKQSIIYNHKLILISLAGLTAGIFILLFTIQIITDFQPWNAGQFLMVFVWLFMALAIVYAGTSFPGLRSKEKSYSYVLLPTSTFEKFLFQLFTRVFLFILIIPGLYWIVFQFEGIFAQVVNPEFTFKSFGYFDAFHLSTEIENTWMKIFTASQGLLFLTIPFFGATVFMKHPIIKTLSWASFVIFIHLMVYFILNQYNVSYFKSGEIGLIVMSSYVLTVNVIMLVWAFYNLKRKQI